jgi:lipopolysaccharide export system protein LptA
MMVVTTNLIRACAVTALAVVGAAAAQAQSLGFGDLADSPLQIEADEGIEWQRANQLYIARGNARAAQGGVTIEADTLIAYYRDGATGSSEIYRLDARGDVAIRSENEVATGSEAVYDVINRILVLTGDEVRLVTPEDTIVAKDSLEYFQKDGLAIARGDALAIRQDRRVRADVLLAHFEQTESAEGSARVDRIEAVGAVHISTPDDIVNADRGDYQLDAGIATLTGNVRITRGDNQLNGEFAEVDFNTGISRITGGPGGQKKERVKVLLLPKPKPVDRPTRKPRS